MTQLDQAPVARFEDRKRSTGLALLIVMALVIFLIAKLEYRSPTSVALLYGYGVTVTTVVLLQMSVAFFRYRDPALHVSDEALAARPMVSCLVAVFNEEDLIHQCVRSLVGQGYANKEIIFVNDASTDGSLAVLNRLAAEHGFTVIDLPHNVGKKRALGAAILRSRGDIIAFSDSDSVWAEDVLERIVPIFADDPTVGAVSGHCRALNPTSSLLTKIQDTWYEGQFSVRKAFESNFGAVTCVSGPLAVFRRDAIFNFIPAWEDDQFLGQEFRFATDRTLTGFVLGAESAGPRLLERYPDTAFSEPKLPLRRWKVLYCKSARSWTEVPDTPRRLIRQQIRWKKSFLRNLFFTGRFYWRRPFLPALVYYLHVLFVLAGPLIAFRHLLYTPLHGNVESMALYLCGIVLIGFMFGLAFKREEPHSDRWVYRPLMSLLSTIVLSWLMIFSLLTLRKMKWERG